MSRYLRTGARGVLALMIMVVGSLVLWVGTPILWLWIGAQVQGATDSLGTALGAAFLGAVITIGVLSVVLSRLSNFYRANAVAQGREDPGHFVLESVLVISAGITLLAFGIWFFFFSGAEPIPIGMQLG